MASRAISTAVQVVKIDWAAGAELPRPQDRLTCRNGGGGWLVLSARWMPGFR